MPLVSNLIKFGGALGGYEIARLICRSQPRILMYHRFSEHCRPGYTTASKFETQVLYIKRNFFPMTLADILQRLDEKKPIPKHAIVITVDDGYRDFYDVAYPILREHSVPATLFVTSGFVDGDIWLWPDKITWLLNQASVVPEAFFVGDVQFLAGSMDPPARSSLWAALIRHLLVIDDAQKHQRIEELAQKLNVALPQSAPDEYQAVTWEDLREISRSGIEIGGHTVTHPSLGRVTRSQAEKEILGCMADLQSHLGNAPRTFCYPNGTPSDVQDFLPEIIEAAGFTGAAVAFPDSQGTQDRFAIRRHASGDKMFQFYKAVSGVELLGHKLRRTNLLPWRFSAFS